MSALSSSDRVATVTMLPRFGTDGATSPEKVDQLRPRSERTAWISHAFGLAMRRSFDVIFCGHVNAVPLAWAIANMQRKPLWLQIHGIEAWQKASTIHQRGVAASDLITSVSRFTRKQLLGWSSIHPERVRVLPNAVSNNGPPFTPNNGGREYSALSKRKIILTVGRLSPSERYKGHDRIIAALPQVLAQVPETTYLIIGEGEDRTRLEDLAQKAGVRDKVEFAGHVPQDALQKYYALADVFAMPSTGEGFGIVFLEAAAAALHVIGGNLDGSVDALAEGRIGRLINPHARDDLAAALVEALNAPKPTSCAELNRFAFANFARHVDGLLSQFTHQAIR